MIWESLIEAGPYHVCNASLRISRSLSQILAEEQCDRKYAFFSQAHVSGRPNQKNLPRISMVLSINGNVNGIGYHLGKGSITR